MPNYSRIIDVTRKPSKCPVCGERPVDIIYGTGDMTEVEFLLEYRKEGIMGGDNIPRRPPIWACPCGGIGLKGTLICSITITEDPRAL